MKVITLGYADEFAKGPAKLIAGPEVGATEQLTFLAEVKAGRKTAPNGVRRISVCQFFEVQAAIGKKPQPKAQPKQED